MSTKHLFLCQGGDAAGAVGEGARSMQAIILPHPRTAEPVRFLLRGGELLEVQKATPTMPASWFVGERVVQDGGIHLATRIDPLFLALPLLERNARTNFSPLDQILASPEFPHSIKLRATAALRPCNTAPGGAEKAQLCHLADVSLAMGEDMPLYRLNEAKATAWLRRKAERLAASIAKDVASRERFASHACGFNSGASSSSPTGTSSATSASTSATAAAGGGEASHPPATAEELRAAKVVAAQIICEYLDPKSAVGWAAKLAAACALATTDLSPSRAMKDKEQKERENERARKWDAVAAAEEEENANHQFTHGAGSQAQAAAKKQKLEDARKNTRAEKQLAKVNKKGMKSMMSFFGAPKKKA